MGWQNISSMVIRDRQSSLRLLCVTSSNFLFSCQLVIQANADGRLLCVPPCLCVSVEILVSYSPQSHGDTEEHRDDLEVKVYLHERLVRPCCAMFLPSLWFLKGPHQKAPRRRRGSAQKIDSRPTQLVPPRILMTMPIGS